MWLKWVFVGISVSIPDGSYGCLLHVYSLSFQRLLRIQFWVCCFKIIPNLMCPFPVYRIEKIGSCNFIFIFVYFIFQSGPTNIQLSPNTMAGRMICGFYWILLSSEVMNILRQGIFMKVGRTTSFLSFLYYFDRDGCVLVWIFFVFCSS